MAYLDGIAQSSVLPRNLLQLEISQWRSEAREAQDRLTFEEREVARLRGKLDVCEEQARTAQDRASWGQSRVVGLASEGRQTAAYCKDLANQLDRETKQSSILLQQVRRYEIEVKELRAQLLTYQDTEVERAGRISDAEARFMAERARQWERFREEFREKEEQKEAERKVYWDEENARKVATQQAQFQQIQELEAALGQSRRDCAALGRKCHAGFEAARYSDGNAVTWQQRAVIAEREVMRLGHERNGMWEAMQRQREEMFRAEELSKQMQTQRDRAVKAQQSEESTGNVVRKWMVQSLDEINRSAHRESYKISKESLGRTGRTWTDLLDAYREQERIRSGYGAGARSASNI